MFFLYFFATYPTKVTFTTKCSIWKSKHIITAFLLTLLSACQTYQLNDPWPERIPSRDIFIQSYLDKKNITHASDSQLGTHLTWIKRFYQGTTLYPNGWLDASDRYLESIASLEQREAIAPKLVDLGVQISTEWAQDNDIRLINSTNIATWADAMRTAAERGEQSIFLEKVERDVQDLLNKNLESRDIKYERYFEEESFDDF